MQQFFLQTMTDRGAGLQFTAAKLQKLPHFPEGEAECLDLPNERQSFQISVAVFAKSALASWWSRKQTIALVEADRIGGETALLCYVADVHSSALPRIYTLDYSP